MGRIGAAVLILSLLLLSLYLIRESGRPHVALIDRPLEDIKKDIAAAAHCTWGAGRGMNIVGIPNRQTCSGPFEENWHSIQMNTTKEGKVDSIIFLPQIGEWYGRGDNPGMRELKRERTATAETISKLFPGWSDAYAWVDGAVARAIEDKFHASIRVDGVSIYVREFTFVDVDYPFAQVVLTPRTDLTEYKESLCYDDEQGPGLDECTDRDGEPRPPENPILHPR